MWFITMNYRETTEDLTKLEGKLANLITDAFKSCIRNYEALLPYLGKRETNYKIHHKLVQVNIMLNKLNEELVAIRIEYVADSPFEQKGETVHCEGSRKRKLSDGPELGRHEAKSIKTEVSFSNSTIINVQSENLVLDDTEVTSNTQVQTLDMQQKMNLEMGIQNSNEAADTHKFSIINSKIPVAHKFCDITNNGMSIHFADDGVSADRLLEDNSCDTSADNVTQKESKEVCIKLQSVKGETSSQEKCDDSSRGVQEKVGHTTSSSHKVKIVLDSTSAEGALGFYGVKKHKKKSFKCTLCGCVITDAGTLYSHVYGKKHQKKLINANNEVSKKSEVPKNNCKNTSTTSVCSTVPRSVAGTAQSESTGSVSECSIVYCSLADSVENIGCESIESDSECSAVSCSLANTVVIVENRYQLMSVKRAVRLDNIWTYFHPPFHINKKYIKFHSGKIICYLCYEEVGRYIVNVRKHIARSNHLDRINRLRNIELENKSSNKQLLDLPGFLENIVPATQFSFRKDGFFCIVCNCFCENTVVLSHMTGESHGKMLDEMKKSE